MLQPNGPDLADDNPATVIGMWGKIGRQGYSQVTWSPKAGTVWEETTGDFLA